MSVHCVNKSEKKNDMGISEKRCSDKNQQQQHINKRSSITRCTFDSEIEIDEVECTMCA